MAFDVLSFVMGQKAAGGSGGSGGGTLPAGVYLTSSPWPQPTNYRYKIYKLNGKIYAGSGNTTSAGYLNYWHEYNEETNTWTELFAATSSNGIADSYLDSYNTVGVEYNGKLHIFSNKRHAVFDGTTFVASTTLPADMPKPVVHQGKLWVISDDNKKIYEWDETTATWTEKGAFSFYPDNAFVVNDNLYVTNSTNVYRYNDDGTVSKVMTLSESLNKFFVIDNKVFAFRSFNQTPKLYKIDVSAGTETAIGRLPSFLTYGISINTNDISFTGLTYSTTSGRVPFFKVNIVE